MKLETIMLSERLSIVTEGHILYDPIYFNYLFYFSYVGVFVVVLGLCCGSQAFSSCSSQAFLVAEHGL